MKFTIKIDPLAGKQMAGFRSTIAFHLTVETAAEILVRARERAQEKAAAFGYSIHNSATPQEIAFEGGDAIAFTFVAEKAPNDAGLVIEELGGPGDTSAQT